MIAKGRRTNNIIHRMYCFYILLGFVAVEVLQLEGDLHNVNSA